MSDTIQLNIQKMPSKTWNSIKVNNKILDWVIPDISYNYEIEKSLDFSQNNFINIETGCGKNIDLLYNNLNDIPVKILSDNIDKEKVVLLSFKAIANKSMFVPIEIVAKKGCKLTVLMDYSADGDNGYLAIQTKFILEKDSSLSLIQLSSINNNNYLINDIGGICDSNANFNLTQVFQKTAYTISGCKVNLTGDESKMNTNVGYYVRDNETIDMNYIVSQYGKKTESKTSFTGSLWNGAKKTLRDTIDFKTNSSESIGDEKENVLLLGDDIVNQTVPVILCSEENVVGTHGASIGKIDEDILFYLSTRGIDEKMAGKILSDSILQSVCSKIENNEIREKATTFLGRCYNEE